MGRLWDIVITSFRLNASAPASACQRVLGLEASAAKRLVSRFPCVCRTGATREDAERIVRALTDAGAKVQLVPHDIARRASQHARQSLPHIDSARLRAPRLAPRTSRLPFAPTLLALPTKEPPLAPPLTRAETQTAAPLVVSAESGHESARVACIPSDGPSCALQPLGAHPLPLAPAARAMAPIGSRAAQNSLPDPDELRFVDEQPVEAPVVARATRSPFQPLFHGIKRYSLAHDRRKTQKLVFPRRPESLKEVALYPLVLAHTFYAAAPSALVLALLVTLSSATLAVRNGDAQDRPLRVRHDVLADRAAIAVVDDGSQRTLARGGHAARGTSRALALAREIERRRSGVRSEGLLAERSALATDASGAAEVAQATRGERAPGTVSDATDAPTRGAEPAFEQADAAEQAGELDPPDETELDPILTLVPASMRGAMASILRKRVMGVHNVAIAWPDAEASEARARSVSCMLIESRGEGAADRVRRMLRTGHELPMTKGLQQQMADHVETLRAASGTDDVDFIPLCLES